MTTEAVFQGIVGKIVSGEITTKAQLTEEKKRISKINRLNKVIRDSDILSCASENTDQVIDLLRKKDTRTISGVTPLAIMTPPLACPPQAQCIYCPGGPKVGSAKAYTGFEPAARRAKAFNFDSYEQAKNRIQQFLNTGHSADKLELIIMGGTFTYQNPRFQDRFMKGCLDAMNNNISETYDQAKLFNETAQHRCIGMTFETRPDCCGKNEIDRMLYYGGTRVELGVQNPDNEIYKIIKRGHTREHVIQATRDLKESAFKVLYHVMPGLPGSSPGKDVEMFKGLFENQDFRPDMLKIYPCLLVDQKYGLTGTYDLWKNGEWEPYNDEQAAQVIAQAHKYIPRYCRVMRIQRDIPTNLLVTGIKYANLRQLVDAEMQNQGIQCQCIRCREIKNRVPEKIELRRIDYEASQGREVFLSLDDADRDKIIGFIRLRLPRKPWRSELQGNTALVRELHVYGKSLQVGHKDDKAVQHKGHGKRLLKEAEEIAKDEFGMDNLAVISGIGVRPYYYKQGYKPEGAYVTKKL